MTDEKPLIGELVVQGPGGLTSQNKLRISVGLGQVMVQEAKRQFVSHRTHHTAPCVGTAHQVCLLACSIPALCYPVLGCSFL